MQRLHATLAPTQSRPPRHGRLLAPDGRYEHAPLTVLTLPADDIDILPATAAALAHPGLDPEIADLVGAFTGQLGVGDQRAGLVSLLARLAGLLDLAPTDDTLGASPGCGPPNPAATAYSATPRRPPTRAPPTG